MTNAQPHRPQIDLDDVRISIDDGLRAISRAHHTQRVLYALHEPGHRRETPYYQHVVQRLDHPALDHLFAEKMPDLTRAIRSEIDGFEYAVLGNLSAFGNPLDQDVTILADWEACQDPWTTDYEAKRSIKKLVAEMTVAHARHEVQEIWRGEKKDHDDAGGWEFFDDFAVAMTDAFNTLTMKPRRFGTFGGYLVSRSTGHAWLPELDDGRFDLVQYHAGMKISMAALQTPDHTEDNALSTPTP